MSERASAWTAHRRERRASAERAWQRHRASDRHGRPPDAGRGARAGRRRSSTGRPAAALGRPAPARRPGPPAPPGDRGRPGDRARPGRGHHGRPVAGRRRDRPVAARRARAATTRRSSRSAWRWRSCGAAVRLAARGVRACAAARIGQAILFDLRRRGVRPHPGAVGVLPRAVHLRPGDLAADLRRRHAHRAARLRPGRAAHRDAQHRRDHGAAVRPRRAAGRASRWPRSSRCGCCTAGSPPGPPRRSGAPARPVATLIVNFVETFNGIRAVQAFRREKRNDAIFAGLNDDYRDANRDAFRLHAVFIPGTDADRQRRPRSPCCSSAATGSLHGGLELGVLTAFLLYLRQFYDPMEDVAVFYNSLQSATAALEKIAAVLAEPPSVPEPADAGRRCPSRSAARVDLDARRVRLPRRPAGAARARPGHPGRADRGARRRDRRRQDDDRQADLALLRPDRRRRCASTASTCATIAEADLRQRGRDGHPGRLPVLRLGRRQHRVRPARRDARRDRRRGPRGRRARVHQRAARRATTPTCASAAAGCRPGSASWSRSRARSWPTRPC